MSNGPARYSGYTSHASDSTSKFIPQVWSGKLVEKFYASTVFGEIANTDYEGEIANFGDSVVIRKVPDITIANYQIGQTITYANPGSTALTLQIDHAKYFSFAVDSIDKYQSDIAEMGKWSDETGNRMKIAIDTDVLAATYSDANASNTGATAGAISGNLGMGAVAAAISVTKSNIIDKIAEMGQVLDEQNIPDDGRWIVAPAWFTTRIKQSDLKDASLSGDGTSMARNGRVGMIDRFTIYRSNLVKKESSGAHEYHVTFGHSAGLTFASQMVQMETLKNPTSFGDLIRGLNVFGFETVNDTCIGDLVCIPA